MSAVSLIQFSSLDLDKLLPLARKVFDRSVSSAADSIDSHPPLHHMLCIAAMKEPSVNPSPQSCKAYMNLFHAGFLVVADERDFSEILEVASMPCILMPTVERGFQAAFIAGTLSQWRDALLRGCIKETSREARSTFNLIYGQFNKLGLSSIFEAYKVESPHDKTFYLEHKR